jgi:hypothetical protein
MMIQIYEDWKQVASKKRVILKSLLCINAMI